MQLIATAEADLRLIADTLNCSMIMLNVSGKEEEARIHQQMQHVAQKQVQVD